MDGPLAPQHESGVNPGILPELLAQVGPEVAVLLRRQLQVDLAALGQSLGAGLGPPPDLAVIVRQAHGLVGLAGTAGHAALAAQARSMLRMAQRGDAAGAARLGTDILPRIDALAAFVAACPLPADRAAP